MARACFQAPKAMQDIEACRTAPSWGGMSIIAMPVVKHWMPIILAEIAIVRSAAMTGLTTGVISNCLTCCRSHTSCPALCRTSFIGSRVQSNTDLSPAAQASAEALQTLTLNLSGSAAKSAWSGAAHMGTQDGLSPARALCRARRRH